MQVNEIERMREKYLFTKAKISEYIFVCLRMREFDLLAAH